MDSILEIDDTRSERYRRHMALVRAIESGGASYISCPTCGRRLDTIVGSAELTEGECRDLADDGYPPAECACSEGRPESAVIMW